MLIRLLREPEALLAHADVAALADHEVVERLHIKQRPGLYDLACNQDVLNIYMENLCILFGSL